MPYETELAALHERCLRVFDPVAASHYGMAVEDLWSGYDPAVRPVVAEHPICRTCPNEGACLLDNRQLCEVRGEMSLRRVPVGLPDERFRNELSAHLTFYPSGVGVGTPRSGREPCFSYTEMAAELEQRMAQRARGEMAWELTT